MDNNWQAAQGQIANAPQGQVGGGVGIPAEMDVGDWRNQLQLDSRMLIANKIMGSLTKCLPFCGQEELQEFKECAIKFEEKIYSVATSQCDYLRKIYLKMIIMELKSQNPLQSNGANMGQNPYDQAMNTPDWRNNLHADSRQRIVNKIMETLTRHLPISGQEGLQELRRIAIRFEDKIYTAATSQSDYLRKIGMKMLNMETMSQNPLQSNGANTGQNPL